MKPNSVNILGRDFEIIYKDNPADVDVECRQSLWGQLDSWERKIRVYEKGKSDKEIFEIILHEVVHQLFIDLNLESFSEEQHTLLCMALADTLVRNNLIFFNNGTL